MGVMNNYPEVDVTISDDSEKPYLEELVRLLESTDWWICLTAALLAVSPTEDHSGTVIQRHAECGHKLCSVLLEAFFADKILSVAWPRAVTEFVTVEDSADLDYAANRARMELFKEAPGSRAYLWARKVSQAWTSIHTQRVDPKPGRPRRALLN